MIKLAYADFKREITEELIEKTAKSIPHFLADLNYDHIMSVMSKKHRPSAYRSLACLCLLGDLLSDMDIPPKIMKTDLGRPYFENIGYIDFNISHSDSLGVCAVCTSDTPGAPPKIGVDCEEIYKKDPFIIANRFFSKSESELLERSMDPGKTFTEIWTKKEAYLKYLGTGLSKPLNSFDSLHIPQKTETFEISNNIITVCTDESFSVNNIMMKNIIL